MRRPRSPCDAGFLLAETLITFALSALVLVGLVSSAAVLLRATDRSVAVVGSADELGRTLAALRRDVSGLKRARWNGEEPQNFVFRGGPNSLFFAQDIPMADGGHELRVVSLREIEVGRGTVLMRAEAHLSALAGGWADLGFGPQRAVPTGVARLRFRYVAEAGPDGRAPRALDTWPSGPTLPAAVIVEAVNAGSTHLIVADRIAVQSDGDIGCADRTGTGDTQRAAPGAPPQAAQPGQAAVAPVPFARDTPRAVANHNEVCGRADKGVGPKAPAVLAAAASPLAEAPR